MLNFKNLNHYLLYLQRGDKVSLLLGQDTDTRFIRNAIVVVPAGIGIDTTFWLNEKVVAPYTIGSSWVPRTKAEINSIRGLSDLDLSLPLCWNFDGRTTIIGWYPIEGKCNRIKSIK